MEIDILLPLIGCSCGYNIALYPQLRTINSQVVEQSNSALKRIKSSLSESRSCRDGADMPRPPYIGKACTRPNLEDLSLFRYLTIMYESLCTQ